MIYIHILCSCSVEDLKMDRQPTLDPSHNRSNSSLGYHILIPIPLDINNLQWLVTLMVVVSMGVQAAGRGWDLVSECVSYSVLGCPDKGIPVPGPYPSVIHQVLPVPGCGGYRDIGVQDMSDDKISPSG